MTDSFGILEPVSGLIHSRLGVALFDGGFDPLPQFILGLLIRKKLSGSVRDGLQIFVKATTRVAILDVRVIRYVRSGTYQFRKLALELLAAHRLWIDAHRRPPLRSD